MITTIERCQVRRTLRDRAKLQLKCSTVNGHTANALASNTFDHWWECQTIIWPSVTVVSRKFWLCLQCHLWNVPKHAESPNVFEHTVKAPIRRDNSWKLKNHFDSSSLQQWATSANLDSRRSVSLQMQSLFESFQVSFNQWSWRVLTWWRYIDIISICHSFMTVNNNQSFTFALGACLRPAIFVTAPQNNANRSSYCN